MEATFHDGYAQMMKQRRMIMVKELIHHKGNMLKEEFIAQVCSEHELTRRKVLEYINELVWKKFCFIKKKDGIEVIIRGDGSLYATEEEIKQETLNGTGPMATGSP